MNKRILLGVDATISPATHYALRKVSELIEEAAPQLRVLLLHVIPIPYVATPSIGLHVMQTLPTTATPEQRIQAEETLRTARMLVQQQGIAPGQVEMLVRVGSPADEIVKAAQELSVDFIVLGSRGDTLKERIRRLFTGSVSHRVLQLAHCPVMIMVSPRTTTPTDLVAWYEQAITCYLREHTSTLTVFTSREVTRMFAPPGKQKSVSGSRIGSYDRGGPGRKERAAAILALEHLSENGILSRHDVKGELRYVND